MEISRIREAVRASRVRITDHAVEEAQNDEVTLDEIHSSVLGGAVIEDYPTDKPYPSCLIQGQDSQGRPFRVGVQ